jgi:hypothetical protein
LFKGFVFLHAIVLLIVGFLPLLLQSFVYYISDLLLPHAVPTASGSGRLQCSGERFSLILLRELLSPRTQCSSSRPVSVPHLLFIAFRRVQSRPAPSLNVGQHLAALSFLPPGGDEA